MSSETPVASVRVSDENGSIADARFTRQGRKLAGNNLGTKSVTPEDGSPNGTADQPTPGNRKNHLNVKNAVVTPASNDSSNQIESPSNAVAPNARRTLFPTPTDRLVTPSLSISQKQRKRSGHDLSPTTVIQSPTPSAKRRLIFGKLVDQIECTPNVKKVYRIVGKLTGSIGGNGYSGPIYGELTMGSMQKMINLMTKYTGLSSSSRFIDVGSGIGKPNLHVAQHPGVEFSCGIEMEHVRWALSITCLNAVLDAAAEQQQQQHLLGQDEAIHSRCVFLHRNIKEARTFDPFTHVYMFSIGFPPDLWLDLSEMWNRSQSEYMICYHSPKDIIQAYGFHVELLTQTQTSMHGSKEGHMGYIYKRTHHQQDALRNNSSSFHVENGNSTIPCDELFMESWKLIQSGLDPLRRSVKQQKKETMEKGPRTRASKRSTLTRL